MKIDICIPAYNEEAIIAESTRSIRDALSESTHEFSIIVADNRSTDGTAMEARAAGAHVLTVSTRGKGAAVVAAARESVADIFCFVDADLSADPKDVLALVEAIESGADIAVGSRLVDTRTVKRGSIRTALSRAFNRMRQIILGIEVQDTQCGMKVMNAKGRAVLAACAETGWFFDIEFLARAEREHLVTHEISINWDEHRFPERQSKLRIVRDGVAALFALARIHRTLVAQYGMLRKKRLVNGSILAEFSRLSLSTADEKSYTLTMTPFTRLAMRLIGVPHLGFRMRARILLKEARRSRADARMLDAGCGYGLYAMSLGESGYTVDAIDIDEKRIEELRRMFDEYPRLKKTITLHAGSLTALPFADSTYDTIVCSEVIEHIPDDLSAVREIGRVMKPGGKLILTVPYDSAFNKRVYKRFDHERPGYTRDSLQDLMEGTGLTIDHEWYYEHTLGTALFNVFNTITAKPLLGILFYPFYILYLIDHYLGVGEPNQIIVTAHKA